MKHAALVPAPDPDTCVLLGATLPCCVIPCSPPHALAVVTAQASPPTTKASNDTLQSNNGVAQASDAPLLPASQQAPIYTGQKAPINTIYRVFGDRVDAGGTPQHGK